MGAKVGTSSSFDDINMTPLIDIVLVVLIIMMVNMPIEIQEMGVKLPGPPKPNPPRVDNPAEQLVIAVYEDETVALNRRLMDEQALLYEVTRRLRPMEHKNVFIDAFPTVRYGLVVDMMDLAREAGAAKVGLARLKPGGPSAPTSVGRGSGMPRGVLLGSPSVLGGGISESKADKVFQPYMPKIQSCYFAALAVQPELSGRMMIKYAIGPEGEHLSEPRIESSNLELPQLDACVEAILPTVGFPKLGYKDDGVGWTAYVKYPVLFSPG